MDLYQANLVETSAATTALASVGKKAFFGLAAAGAAWTYESIKWAQNYQSALVQLRTQAGLTVTAMNAIGKAAMANAASLGISPTAYLQAAYHPASTGYGVAQTIAITNYGAKLAAIGGASPEDTVNSLTSTMKAYGFGKNQTEHTAALLNAIVGSGNMHWSDLNAALNSGVASTAKTFGVSLGSLGGALARLTDLGTPAAQAGTRLRMAMALLGAPTQESDKLLTAAGLDTTSATAASGAMASALVAAGLTTTQLSSALRNNSGAGGIYNALELLHKQLSGMSPEAQSALLSRAFGGGRMGTSIMQLYSNLPALQAKSGQIAGGSTNKKFMDDWVATTKTLRFQLHSLEGELETLGTQFGTVVLPPLTKVVEGFTDLLKFLDQNKAIAVALGGVITAVLAPAIGVYLYRSLLSSGGAIRTVIQGYAQLITGQTAEQAALAKTDASLATNTTALRVNAAAASGDDAALLGGGAGLSGVGIGAGGLLGAAVLGAGIYGLYKTRNQAAPRTYAQARIQEALHPANQVGMGGLVAPLNLSKPIGSQGLTTDSIAGLYGAIAEGDTVSAGISKAYAAKQLENLHLPNGRILADVHVYLDSKELKNGVVKQVRKTAARS